MRSAWRSLLLWFFVSALTVICGYALHLKVGFEQLGAWGAFLTGSGTLVLGFGAIYAVIHGVEEYRDRTNAERLRWLSQLQAEFFEGRTFSFIRRKVDYDELDDVMNLLHRDDDPNAKFESEEKELFDKFTDYLNFFEFIAYLYYEKQMLRKDVEALFDYYLRRLVEIRQADDLLAYLKRNNFENLSKLLVEYRQKSKGRAA